MVIADIKPYLKCVRRLTSVRFKKVFFYKPESKDILWNGKIMMTSSADTL